MTYQSPESGFVFPGELVDQSSFTAAFYNDLLRGMTHKLNNLLAIIQGFSSLILMQDDLDPLIRENLVHMKEASASASTLGERVLPAGGCSRIEPSSVNLSETMPLLMARLKGMIEGAKLILVANISADLPTIISDQSRIRDILTELVKNAIEASKPEDKITIDIVYPGDSSDHLVKNVDIFVRNAGNTIPKEKLLDIFRPFYTNKDSTHYGIGLTIAHVLANRMKAPLGVKSEDGTTTFWLRLPAS